MVGVPYELQPSAGAASVGVLRYSRTSRAQGMLRPTTPGPTVAGSLAPCPPELPITAREE